MSFSSFPRRSPGFLGLAAILPLLAVGLELVFPALIGQIGPGLMFIGAIVLAAWHRGLKAGIAAALWSALWSAFSIFRSRPHRNQRRSIWKRRRLACFSW